MSSSISPIKSAIRLAIALAASLLAACGNAHDGNFSQAPGFARWRASHPPAEQVPDAQAQVLLRHYRPRFYLSAGSDPPIAFYRDYIAHGRLTRRDGDPVAERVDRALLNRHKHEPGIVFTYEPAPAAGAPTVFGRIDRDTLPGTDRQFIFLTYNLVFRYSGLPAGMPGWLELLAGLAADPDDWHQLDLYTAVTLALVPGDTPTPVAVTFQQHNYLHTYLLGAHPAHGVLTLPPDGRLRVDIARRSNELYPHTPARARHRAVDFFNPDNARYLITGEDPPWLRADDVTDPAFELDYRLAFLPQTDAFYVFEGWLGALRRLPGRDGPPGADYNTSPLFKPKAVQMAVFYWHEDDPGYLERLDELYAHNRPQRGHLKPFVQAFLGDLRRARAARAHMDDTPFTRPTRDDLTIRRRNMQRDRP